MVEEKYKKILIKTIEKHIPNCKIYLFGSRAQKKHPETSDIDISIDTGHAIDIGIIGKIKDDLIESIIPYFVDIVDFNITTPIMKTQILKNGIIWKN